MESNATQNKRMNTGYKTPEYSSAQELQKTFLEGSKTDLSPGVPVASELSSVMGTDILAPKSKGRVNLYKSIINSQGSNDFIKQYGEYKQNSIATASYISNLAVQTLQFALKQAYAPSSFREIIRLNSMLSKIQSLNYTEEDSIKIAEVFENYQASIVAGAPLTLISRDAYNDLDKIFAEAMAKDDEDFLSNSKHWLQVILNPLTIGQAFVHGGASTVDSILNIGYRIAQIGNPDNDYRVDFFEKLVEEAVGISSKDLKKIHQSRFLRAVHGTPFAMIGSPFGKAILSGWKTASAFGGAYLFDWIGADAMKDIQKKLGVSDADFDAITTSFFIGMAELHKYSRQGTGSKNRYDIMSENTYYERVKDIKTDLFNPEGEGPNKPKGLPEGSPEGPNKPKGSGPNEPNIPGGNTAEPDPIKQDPPKFDTSGSSLFKPPKSIRERAMKREPVSTRQYVDSLSASAEDGGLIVDYMDFETEYIENKILTEKYEHVCLETLKNQGYDPKASIDIMNQFSEIVLENGDRIVSMTPRTVGERVYLDNVIEGTMAVEDVLDASVFHEGNTIQWEPIIEGLESPDANTRNVALNAKLKLDKSFSNHVIHEIIGDRFNYSMDAEGRAINYKGDRSRFISGYGNERVASEITSLVMSVANDSILDKSRMDYKLYNEAVATLKKEVLSCKHVDFNRTLNLEAFKELERGLYDQVLMKVVNEAISSEVERSAGPSDLPEIINAIERSEDGLIRSGKKDVKLPLEYLFSIRQTVQKGMVSRASLTSVEASAFRDTLDLINTSIETIYEGIDGLEGFEEFSKNKKFADKKHHTMMQDLEQNVGFSRAEMARIGRKASSKDVKTVDLAKDKLSKFINEYRLLNASSILDHMNGENAGSTNLPVAFNAYNAQFMLKNIMKHFFKEENGVFIADNTKLSKMFESSWMQTNGHLLTRAEKKLLRSIQDMAIRREKAYNNASKNIYMRKLDAENPNPIKSYVGKGIKLAKRSVGIKEESVDLVRKIKEVTDPLISWSFFLAFFKKGK